MAMMPAQRDQVAQVLLDNGTGRGGHGPHPRAHPCAHAWPGALPRR